jgi:hypothetical protein
VVAGRVRPATCAAYEGRGLRSVAGAFAPRMTQSGAMRGRDERLAAAAAVRADGWASIERAAAMPRVIAQPGKAACASTSFSINCASVTTS